MLMDLDKPLVCEQVVEVGLYIQYHLQWISLNQTPVNQTSRLCTGCNKVATAWKPD